MNKALGHLITSLTSPRDNTRLVMNIIEDHEGDIYLRRRTGLQGIAARFVLTR